MNRKGNVEENSNVQKSPENGKDCTLILHNDDVHDFMYVIESLIEICDHELVQAEQCTYLVHYRGSSEVKKGKCEHLKEMYNQLIDKGLTVSIN